MTKSALVRWAASSGRGRVKSYFWRVVCLLSANHMTKSALNRGGASFGLLRGWAGVCGQKPLPIVLFNKI